MRNKSRMKAQHKQTSSSEPFLRPLAFSTYTFHSLLSKPKPANNILLLSLNQWTHFPVELCIFVDPKILSLGFFSKSSNKYESVQKLISFVKYSASTFTHRRSSPLLIFHIWCILCKYLTPKVLVSISTQEFIYVTF